MENIIQVRHQCLQLKSNFDDFTKKLESALKHLDPGYADHILDNPKVVEKYLSGLAGDIGFMIFSIQRHGDLLSIYGKARKANQYVIGNPLIAIQMTQHDIRSSLYAPLRITVYEGADKYSYIEYDLPSSLLGQFGNGKILEVAKGLDEKLLNIIKIVDQ